MLYSRTEWYKVRAPHGQEGWARRSDLALTRLASGEPAPIPPYPDFATHRWEIGAAGRGLLVDAGDQAFEVGGCVRGDADPQRRWKVRCATQPTCQA